MPEHYPFETGVAAVIKVVGIGSGGGKILNQMVQQNVRGAEFIFVGMDADTISHSLAKTRLFLGPKNALSLPGNGRVQAETWSSYDFV